MVMKILPDKYLRNDSLCSLTVVWCSVLGQVVLSQCQITSAFEDAKINDSFIYDATKLWNIAPESIKNTNTLMSAKAEIKNFCTSLPLWSRFLSNPSFLIYKSRVLKRINVYYYLATLKSVRLIRQSLFNMAFRKAIYEPNFINFFIKQVPRQSLSLIITLLTKLTSYKKQVRSLIFTDLK